MPDSANALISLARGDAAGAALAAAAMIPSAGMGATSAKLAARYGDQAAAVAQRAVRDEPTKKTNEWSAWFNSEGEARALAREKPGKNPIEIGRGKWRSRDGKWQYRAKPKDVRQSHIHLEELDPHTGEVLQNLHLRWPEGKSR